MENGFSVKEGFYIEDLLAYEEQAVKKARLYSKTLTDKYLADFFSKIAESHVKSFGAILNLL